MTQTWSAALREWEGLGWGVISSGANVSAAARRAGGARQLLVSLVRDQYSLTALRCQAKLADYCTLGLHV